MAINGLGTEYLLGTSGGGRTPAVTALDVFPNPFTSGELTVQFATGGLGGVGDAVVAVYDVTGRLVRTLAAGRYAARGRTRDVGWS